MFKRMRNKGALFIEYALILAFVIGGGLTFVTANGFSDSVGDIFGKTGDTLAKAAGEVKNSNLINSSSKLISGFWAGNQSGTYGSRGTNEFVDRLYNGESDNGLFNLEANKDYEITFDLDKLKALDFDASDNLRIAIVGWTPDANTYNNSQVDFTNVGLWVEDGSDYSSYINSTYTNATKITDSSQNPYAGAKLTRSVSENGNTVTYKFSTNSAALNVGMNFRVSKPNASKDYDKMLERANLSDVITLKKSEK